MNIEQLEEKAARHRKVKQAAIKVKQERLANFAQRPRELEYNRDLNKQLKSIEL